MTSRGIWRRQSRSSSALLLAALIVTACGAAQPSNSDDLAGLVFTRPASSEKPSVWIADADGSNARQIAAHGWGPTLSPDGRWVTYAVPAGDEHLRTYVRAVGGGKPRKLGDVGVVWSPNGKLVAVSDEKLLVVDPETGESRDLVRSDVINWRGFSFAPDGKALAYARADGRTGHEFEADVFVLRLSDGKTVQLTHDGHSDRPVWGGDWIAYRHFKFVNADHWPSIGEIRLVRSDGSGDRFFARGDEDTSMAHYGIEPVELSASGTRLLACYSHEFGCPPVAFTVPDGRRYELPIEVRNGVTALDLARDGTDVLAETGLHVGPYDVYSIPFEGGQARLLVKDAGGANWAR